MGTKTRARISFIHFCFFLLCHVRLLLLPHRDWTRLYSVRLTCTLARKKFHLFWPGFSNTTLSDFGHSIRDAIPFDRNFPFLYRWRWAMSMRWMNEIESDSWQLITAQNHENKTWISLYPTLWRPIICHRLRAVARVSYLLWIAEYQPLREQENIQIHEMVLQTKTEQPITGNDVIH